MNLFLEFVAVIFGFLSVWFAKGNNILVYPTGIISTLIYVWILFKNQLLGDLIINAYFFSALSISDVFEDYIESEKLKYVANRLLYLFAIIIPISTLLLIFKLSL